MKTFITRLIMVAALFITGVAHAEVQLGKDYTMLNSAQPAATNKIEVQEFFFYQCIHCFHLHPLLAKWEKTKPADVEINYVPVMFQPAAEPLAYTFYALEAMGKLQKLDDEIYQAVHVKQLNLYDVSSIGEFVGNYGVDKNKFAENYNSFAVATKIKHAKQMMRTYGIEGTPTLIVDGRFVISGLQPEDSIRVLNELIAKVRKERAPTKKH